MNIKPIRTPDDLATAKDRLKSLMLHNVHGGFDDEMEVLSALVEQYEKSYARVDAPSPVAAIRFRMEEMELTPRQLEPFIGSRARVSEVLSEKRQLSIDMIRSLHEGLGIPYESLIAQRPRSATIQNISAPTIRHLNSVGFDLDKQTLPSFIKTSAQRRSAPALLRKTRTQRAASKTDQAALLLWQAAILNQCAKNQTARFDPSTFSTSELRAIAKLSSKPQGPRRAVNALAILGISVVTLPPLPGTFLDGAAMLAPNGNPVVGLTLRHDRVDSFWFTLLHELSHVLLHYSELLQEKAAFIDDLEIRSEDTFEREADQLARDSLIPSSILAQVTWGELTSQDEIIAVASRARVHVSVVAGRWQRDHQNYKKFARLIERETIRSMLSK